MKHHHLVLSVFMLASLGLAGCGTRTTTAPTQQRANTASYRDSARLPVMPLISADQRAAERIERPRPAAREPREPMPRGLGLQAPSPVDVAPAPPNGTGSMVGLAPDHDGTAEFIAMDDSETTGSAKLVEELDAVRITLTLSGAKGGPRHVFLTDRIRCEKGADDAMSGTSGGRYIGEIIVDRAGTSRTEFTVMGANLDPDNKDSLLNKVIVIQESPDAPVNVACARIRSAPSA